MTIKIIEGNLFASQAQVLVNPVNCVGIMGAGLAKAFKSKYSPDYFESYYEDCREKRMRVDNPILYKKTTPWILNFATKEDFRNPSQLLYIQKGLLTLPEIIKSNEIKSIAFPKLGSGLGGLEWSRVKKIMIFYLKDIPPCDIEIYE